MSADWTEGVPALLYQHCEACRAVWYFRRAFCPRCGAPAPEIRHASGAAVIRSLTTVMRAPTPDWQADLPYTLALAEAAEGFRLMGHAAPELRLGDAVRIGFRSRAGRLVPWFAPEPAP